MSLDTYLHGIYTEEVPTVLTPMITVAAPTVAFGTAPVHLASAPVAANTPVLCNTLADFVSAFGWSDDFDSYTLCEVARVHFQLFRTAPVIFVNVLDTDKHVKTGSLTVEGVANPATIPLPIVLSTIKISSGSKPVTATVLGVTDDEPITIPATINAADMTVKAGDVELALTTDYTIGTGTIILTEAGLAKVDGSLTFTSGEDTYVEFTADDYTAAHDDNGATVITVISTNKVVDDKIAISYSAVDAAAVGASDIIGGVDSDGQNTGLELIEEIYPRFSLVPGSIIAPKFSTDTAVAAIMKAKATDINGVFKSMAIVDISTDEARRYTDANAIKNQNNLVDSHLIVCYPKVALGGVQYHLSNQAAAVCAVTDSNHSDIPYKSPSNENLQADQSILADGTDAFLGKAAANYLNSVGIVTALNFIGGWKLWGNRTSVYPADSDPKDAFIACRRMMNWVSNTLVTSFWSKIDEPINRRLVESVVQRANVWFNGLQARGAILGGRCEFNRSDNPDTDLADGILHFKVYLGLIPPARAITFTLEFDTTYFNSLFE